MIDPTALLVFQLLFSKPKQVASFSIGPAPIQLVQTNVGASEASLEGVSGSTPGMGLPDLSHAGQAQRRRVVEQQPTASNPPAEGWNADNAPGFGVTCFSTTQCLNQHFGNPETCPDGTASQGSCATPEGKK